MTWKFLSYFLQRDPETKPAISRIGSSKKVNSGFLSWNPFVTEISSGTMSLLLLTSRPLQFIQVRPLQQSEFSWLKRASKEVDSTSTIFISWKITFDFHFRLWPYWLIEYILCRQISFSFRDSVFLHPLSGIYISAGDYIIRVNDVTDDITAFMEVSIGFSDDLKYDFFCEKVELICSLFSWGLDIFGRIKGDYFKDFGYKSVFCFTAWLCLSTILPEAGRIGPPKR